MVVLGVLVGLFAILVAQVGAAAIHDLTLYEKIETKCPSVSKFPEIEAENELRKCKSWNGIQAVDSIENIAKKADVLCLIYYNAFVTYCTKNPDLLNVSVPKDLNYNLNVVCDNLDVIGEDGEESAHLHKIVKNKEVCQNTCDLSMGYIHLTCMKAYYYIHLNTTRKVQNEIKPKPINLAEPQDKQEAPVQSLAPAQAAAGASSTSLKTPAKVNADAKAKNAGPANQASGPTVDKLAVPVAVANSAETANSVQAGNPAKPEVIPQSKNAVKTPSVGIKVGSEVQEQSKEPSKAEDKAVSVGTQGQAPLIASDDVVPPQVESVKNKESSVVEAPEGAGNGAAEAPEGAGDGAEENAGTFDKIKNDDKKPAEDAGRIPPDEDSFAAENEEQDLPDDPFEKENLPAAAAKPPHSNPATAGIKSEESMSDSRYSNDTVDEGDSYFFTFFMLLCVIFIVGYISYHNKQKILALILEGRRGKRQYRNRRPNSANYHKLDTNLEEAITSSTVNKNTNNVIY